METEKTRELRALDYRCDDVEKSIMRDFLHSYAFHYTDWDGISDVTIALNKIVEKRVDADFTDLEFMERYMIRSLLYGRVIDECLRIVFQY